MRESGSQFVNQVEIKVNKKKQLPFAQNYSRSHANGQTDSNVFSFGRRIASVAGAWFGNAGPS